MTIGMFLTTFYQSTASRRAAFGAAQAHGDIVLIDDLIFLAAVHVWRNGTHGKRNAMQIYTMSVMAKSSAIQSEYQISVARNPPDNSVAALKIAMGPIIIQAASRRQHDKRIEGLQNAGGGFNSLKSAFISLKYKAGSPTRTTDGTLFDGVVNAVIDPNGLIAQWVGPMNVYPGGQNPDLSQEPFKGAITRLSGGVGGGHMNPADVGLY